MKTFLKWAGLGLLGLLAAVLLLVLAWVASNWHDAEPQPIPAALVAPPAQSGEGGLLAALTAAPRSSFSSPWPKCSGTDCRAAFEAQATAFEAWHKAQADFGAACEAALQATTLRLGEPLPAKWSPNMELPSYSPVSTCHAWLLMQAWRAAQRGEPDATLAALKQASRLEHLVRDESRLLIGQMIGASMAGRELMLIAAVAPQFPAQREPLAALAALPGETLVAATRRWVPAEAAFGRAFNDQLRDGSLSPAGAASAPLGVWERLGARFTHPNRTQQLFDAHWLGMLNCLQGQDMARAADCAHVEPQPGPLPGGLRWRHTTAHILHDIALPSWHSYLNRAADLQHASQATQAWLRGQPPTAAIDTAADGTWTLRLRAAGQSHRLPTQWAPLPKDH